VVAYIVSKQNRFFVVTYDGLDPTTGKEHRRWHLTGDSREDAEAIAANLTRRTDLVRDRARSAATVTDFVNETWFPQRVQHLLPSMAHRYRWMIDNYISPTIVDLPIRSLRAEHLNRLYTDLLATGKRNGTGLAPKTVYDVHVIMRAALKHAVRIHLVEHNVALDANAPRPTARAKQGPEAWTTRSSPTPKGDRSTRNRSANSSHANSLASISRRSDSTISATPTPPCSQARAPQSRSYPNASATPTPASPWPPTNTSCPARAPPPPTGSVSCCPHSVTLDRATADTPPDPQPGGV
jgi:hypothetical protein